MVSIEGLIREVASIKVTSDQLAVMVGSANVNMSNQLSTISAFARGSQTGQEAVMALSMATRSLADAASAIKALSRICDTCVANLSR